jgi:four helix bundle protein
MTEIPMSKTYYDLEERSFEFAKNVTIFCKELPQNVSNLEYKKQVIKSSGSVGANYIEANESLSRKDFLLRMKICRKEAKESVYWLRLIIETNSEESKKLGQSLLNESIELKKIFSSIIEKSK